jgi:hypothetical protein
MLNNFIYYYVLFIIALISINLLIKLGKYIYIYIRNRYFYKGYYYKTKDPLYNSFKQFFVFTPRHKETIFGNYYNMLKIVLSILYGSKLYKTENVYIIFILYNSKTKSYVTLSESCLLDLVNKPNALTMFNRIKWTNQAYDLNNYNNSIIILIKNNKTNYPL